MVASIGDVAVRAGVSVATVSRALRGLPNVAPSTRERVLKAADELHYVADPHASRLATGVSHTVGMVAPLFTQWFFTQVVAGAEAVLSAAGLDLLLYNAGGVEERARFLRTMPHRKRVDGLIVIGVWLSDEEQDRLVGSVGATVGVGLRSSCMPTVGIDNAGAASTATRHLVNLGHERIGLISGLSDDPLHFSAPLERRRGYQHALREAGLAYRADLDVPGNFSMKGGAEAMAQLLAADRPPTGVFAESDEMAVGALKTLRDSGLRVPGDVALVGFDDQEIAEYVGLTTIAQPALAMGEVAATMLLERIRGADRQQLPVVELPTKLVVRATTGPRRGPAAVEPPGPAVAEPA